jgi:hypothetical protein
MSTESERFRWPVRAQILQKTRGKIALLKRACKEDITNIWRFKKEHYKKFKNFVTGLKQKQKPLNVLNCDKQR